jgi:hypothetical protein
MAALKMRVSQILIIAVALALLGLPYLFLYQKPSVQHMLTNFNSSILQPHNHLVSLALLYYLLLFHFCVWFAPK